MPQLFKDLPLATDLNNDDVFPFTQDPLGTPGDKRAPWSLVASTLQGLYASLFAPIANGVTNGDSHDHTAGAGAQIDHGSQSGLDDNDHPHYMLKAVYDLNANDIVDDAEKLAGVTPTSAGLALLDDLDNAAQRTTLGLGDAAVKNTGTAAGTVAAGDHSHAGVYEPADPTILKDADIGVSVSAEGHNHDGSYEPSGAITAHELASDPHPGYQRDSEKGVANGYASLGADGLVPSSQLPASSAGDMQKSIYDADEDGFVDAAEGLRETSGPTTLSISGVGDGDFLRRSGNTIIGDTPAGSGDMIKSTYDQDDDGVVDDSEKLAGVTPTSAGLALLDDADPAAQRTTLGLGDAAEKNVGTVAGTVAEGDHNHDSVYAPAAEGVTNGDSHDHSGGDGGQIDHGSLSNAGVKSHADIDTHIGHAEVFKKTGLIWSPNALYNDDTQIPVFRADANITIQRIHVSGNTALPASDLDLNLKHATDLTVFSNATMIDVCDTSNGIVTITSGFDDATVPAGSYVYWEFDVQPHTDWKWIWFEIYYTYD